MAVDKEQCLTWETVKSLVRATSGAHRCSSDVAYKQNVRKTLFATREHSPDLAQSPQPGSILSHFRFCLLHLVHAILAVPSRLLALMLEREPCLITNAALLSYECGFRVLAREERRFRIYQSGECIAHGPHFVSEAHARGAQRPTFCGLFADS